MCRHSRVDPSRITPYLLMTPRRSITSGVESTYFSMAFHIASEFSEPVKLANRHPSLLPLYTLPLGARFYLSIYSIWVFSTPSPRSLNKILPPLSSHPLFLTLGNHISLLWNPIARHAQSFVVSSPNRENWVMVTFPDIQTVAYSTSVSVSSILR